MVFDAKRFDDLEAVAGKILAIVRSLGAVELNGVDANGIGYFKQWSDGFIDKYTDFGNKGRQLCDNASGCGRSDVAGTAGKKDKTERVSPRFDCGAGVIEICEATDLNANEHCGSKNRAGQGRRQRGEGRKPGWQKGRPPNPIEKGDPVITILNHAMALPLPVFLNLLGFSTLTEKR